MVEMIAALRPRIGVSWPGIRSWARLLLKGRTRRMEEAREMPPGGYLEQKSPDTWRRHARPFPVVAM